MKNVNTVAQALRRIKELKGLIATATERMKNSNCWTEPGPARIYDFDTVQKERTALIEELVTLKARLARTNCETKITVKMTTASLQKFIFALSELKSDRALIQGLSIREGEGKAPTGEFDEHGHPKYVTVKMLASLGLRARDERVSALEQDIALIHEAIEDANHRTTLLD